MIKNTLFKTIIIHFFFVVIFTFITSNYSPILAQNIAGQNLEIKPNQVISIFSVNITYNNFNLTRFSKTKCQLEFFDDYRQQTTKIIDDSTNYVVMYSNPGKVYLDNIKCQNHGAPLLYGHSRVKKIDDWGFVAYTGFINYAGEINIKYYSDKFKFLDLINLSALNDDSSGILQIEVKDQILNNINYIKFRFQDFSQFKIAKSLLKDSISLKPNDTPETYEIQDFINGGKSLENKQDNSLNQNKIDNKINPQKNIDTINIYESMSNRNNDYINNPSGQIKDPVKPRHPYLAPIYSEFYTPIYNPYLSVGNPANPYGITEVQDPAIETHY